MNFSRAELKMRAKEVLSVKYWSFFLVGILQYIAVSIFSFNINVNELKNIQNIPMFVMFGAISVVFSILIGIFLKNPLRVAICRFMIVNSENVDVNYNSLWGVFKEGYINVVKATFIKSLLLSIYEIVCVIGLVGVLLSSWTVKDVFVSLYGIVFIISLVIYIGGLGLSVNRLYAYYMVDYLLAERSDMGWRDAINTSKEMMRGVKFKTFILELSFLGWILLGLMACGIGTLFVMPYQNATVTQLYIELRNERNLGYKIV